jgi:hypothetical protein
MVKLGSIFILNNDAYGKVSQVGSLGVMYHTLDFMGNCIMGERYVLKVTILK